MEVCQLKYLLPFSVSKLPVQIWIYCYCSCEMDCRRVISNNYTKYKKLFNWLPKARGF